MLNIRFLDQEDMFYPISEHIILLMCEHSRDDL